MSFEEYWETDGSRRDVADHKERARLAWEVAWEEGKAWGRELEWEDQRFNDWEEACMASSE